MTVMISMALMLNNTASDDDADDDHNNTCDGVPWCYGTKS